MTMRNARSDILSRVRTSLGSRARDPGAIRQEAETLAGQPDTVQPKFAGRSLEEQFLLKATSESVTATVSSVENMNQVPAAAGDYLQEAGLAPRIVLQPSARLLNLDWTGIETDTAASSEEPAILTLAEYGIAETGSVVFLSSRESPVLHNFVALHHLVALEKNRILPHIEDLWAAMAEAGIAHPRSVNIVTGTSGTADIEARNVRGAHGPRFMRILLIG